MTRDEGVALIKQHLGFRQTLDAEIVTQMRFAQTTLEKAQTKPWFLKSAITPLDTVASTATITLPTGFICEIEDQELYYTDADGELQFVYKDDFNLLQRNFRYTEPGRPQAYALLNEDIYLFPTPDDIYNLSWRFYQADTVLDTNVENKWLREVPLLLCGTAGQLIAGGPLRDKGGKDIFSEWIALGLTIVKNHDSQREVAGRVMQMGGPHN